MRWAWIIRHPAQCRIERSPRRSPCRCGGSGVAGSPVALPSRRVKNSSVPLLGQPSGIGPGCGVGGTIHHDTEPRWRMSAKGQRLRMMARQAESLEQKEETKNAGRSGAFMATFFRLAFLLRGALLTSIISIWPGRVTARLTMSFVPPPPGNATTRSGLPSSSIR